MSPLQSVQRRTGFETLEAKKLFAADLMAGAAAPMVDDVVADFSPGDLTSVQVDPGDLTSVQVDPGELTSVQVDPGELASVQMSPADAAVEFSARVFDGTGGFSYFGNLGGQEGEDFNSQTDTNFDYPVGDFDVDGDVDGDDLVAEFDPGGLTSVQMNPADVAIEFSTRVFDGTGGFSYAENLGGQEGEPFENHDHDHPNLGDGHTDNLLTGPQEGEPLIEESDLAASIAPDGCVDLADHVFEQYAEEIGAHNTQWDLLYAK